MSSVPQNDSQPRPATPCPLTIADVLSLPALAGVPLRVLVGKDDLHRPIRWVHVAESPRVAQLLSGGELLLTTGAGWQGIDLRAVVAELAKVRAAVLVVELGTEWVTPPRELVDACREHSLPLVCIEEEIRFVDISEQIHHHLLEQETQRATSMRHIAETFTAMMIRGASPEQIITHAARLLGAPIILENPLHQVVYYSEGHRPPSALLQQWAARSRRWEARLGRVGTIIAPTPLPDGEGYCLDVTARGTQWGRLVYLEEEADGQGSELSRELKIAPGYVLQQAAIALLVERHGARDPQSWQDLRDRTALERLLGNRFTTVDGMTEVLNAQGFRTHERFLYALEFRQPLGVDEIRRVLTRHSPPWDVLIAPPPEHPQHVVALISATDSSPREVIPELVQRHWPEAVVLMSPAVRSPLDVVHAVRLLGSQPEQSPGFRVVGSTPLSVLMTHLADNVHLADFSQQILGPLLRYDAQNKSDLLATLRVLVEHPTSRSAASAELHISRTALYTRISTIENLLGMTLSRGSDLFSLHLALCAFDAGNRGDL